MWELVFSFKEFLSDGFSAPPVTHSHIVSLPFKKPLMQISTERIISTMSWYISNYTLEIKCQLLDKSLNLQIKIITNLTIHYFKVFSVIETNPENELTTSNVLHVDFDHHYQTVQIVFKLWNNTWHSKEMLHIFKYRSLSLLCSIVWIFESPFALNSYHWCGKLKMNLVEQFFSFIFSTLQVI